MPSWLSVGPRACASRPGDVDFAFARSVGDQLDHAAAEVRPLVEKTAGAVRLSVAPEFNWTVFAD